MAGLPPCGLAVTARALQVWEWTPREGEPVGRPGLKGGMATRQRGCEGEGTPCHTSSTVMGLPERWLMCYSDVSGDAQKGHFLPLGQPLQRLQVKNKAGEMRNKGGNEGKCHHRSQRKPVNGPSFHLGQVRMSSGRPICAT